MYIIAKVDKGLIINLETFVYSLKTAYMNIFFLKTVRYALVALVAAYKEVHLTKQSLFNFEKTDEPSRKLVRKLVI